MQIANKMPNVRNVEKLVFLVKKNNGVKIIKIHKVLTYQRCGENLFKKNPHKSLFKEISFVSAILFETAGIAETVKMATVYKTFQTRNGISREKILFLVFLNIVP